MMQGPPQVASGWPTFHKKLIKAFVSNSEFRIQKVSNLIEGINFGVIAQNIEGRTLRRVLLKGIQENIFALLIHDAVAAGLMIP